MNVNIASDFLNLLPRHTDEELKLLTAACKADPEHKAMPPVYVWGNQKNTILDGHNQHKIRSKLNLKIRYEKKEFESRDQAMAWAIDIQFSRRNVDASVRAMALSKLPKQTDMSSNGQLATASREEIAEKHGVGRRTLQRADKVREEAAPAVIEAAEQGEVAVSDAAAIVELPKARQEKAVAAVKAGKAKTLKEAAKVETPSEDEVGNPIPDKLSAEFAMAGEFEEQARALTKVQQWVKSMDGKPAAAFLHAQSLVADLENAKRALRFSAPYAVCPYCSAKKAKCEACHGVGYVNKTVYNAAPQELRA